MLLEVVGVVAEEIDGLLRFAERLHAVLADFQRQRGGDVVDALLHEVADLAQQRARARRPGVARQAGKAACAAAIAASTSLGVGEREFAE